MADPQDHLPLNPGVFAVLMALLDGPAHGYRLRGTVEAQGRVTMDPGTLYRTIARLVDQGLAEEVAAPDGEPTTDSRRRYYSATELGRRVAAAETARLRSLMDHAARARLLPEH